MMKTVFLMTIIVIQPFTCILADGMEYTRLISNAIDIRFKNKTSSNGLDEEDYPELVTNQPRYQYEKSLMPETIDDYDEEMRRMREKDDIYCDYVVRAVHLSESTSSSPMERRNFPRFL